MWLTRVSRDVQRVDVGEFEEKYRVDGDPWRFETSPYEQGRYDQIIAALGARHFRRAFEPGCSIGVLTHRLAERAAEVIGVDASPSAVAAARERLREVPNAHVEVGVIPEWWPDGTFDLVVFSELGYYWDVGGIDELVGRLAGLLEPGGLLVAVHWLGTSPDHLLSGLEVHDRLVAQLGPSRGRREHTYRRGDGRSRSESFVIEGWGVP